MISLIKKMIPQFLPPKYTKEPLNIKKKTKNASGEVIFFGIFGSSFAVETLKYLS